VLLGRYRICAQSASACSVFSIEYSTFTCLNDLKILVKIRGSKVVFAEVERKIYLSGAVNVIISLSVSMTIDIFE